MLRAGGAKLCFFIFKNIGVDPRTKRFMVLKVEISNGNRLVGESILM